MTMQKRANLVFLVLAIVFCRFAYGESPVNSLFNQKYFIEEGSPFLTEKFWSTPTNTLYGKSVADWRDEDFAALDMELRKGIYALSLGDNPLRDIQGGRLQRAVDLVPSFRAWARRGREATHRAPAVQPGQPAWFAQPASHGKLMRYGIKYGLPVISILIIIGALGIVVISLYRRVTVPFCPKCKITEKQMLTVRTRSFDSLFRRGKRKCYCSACGYKWIQR